jgi:hypothetical protein
MRETNHYTLDDQDIDNLKTGKQFTFTISPGQAIVVDYEPTLPPIEMARQSVTVTQPRQVGRPRKHRPTLRERPIVVRHEGESVPLGPQELRLYRLLCQRGATEMKWLRHNFSRHAYGFAHALVIKGVARKGYFTGLESVGVEAVPNLDVHLTNSIQGRRGEREPLTPLPPAEPEKVTEPIEPPQAESEPAAEVSLSPTELKIVNLIRKKGPLTSHQALKGVGINYYSPITTLLRKGILTREGSSKNPLQLNGAAT